MAKGKNARAKPEFVDNPLLPVKMPSRRGVPEGRPSAITPTVLERLRQAFLIGCDDEEAALHAGIALKTIYNHQKVNPEFLQWKRALKQTPFLTARKTIVDNLSRDPEFAMRYMERKKRAEFSPSAKITIEEGGVVLDDEQKTKVGNALAVHMQKIAERAQQNGQ